MSIRIKRAYAEAADDDGKRVLVDRLWPRGIKKEALKMDAWIKDIAPTNELRKWFGHEPPKFPEFRTRFRAELDTHADALAPLLDMAKEGTLTLLFSAKDEEHNNAVVIREYLNEKLGK